MPRIPRVSSRKAAGQPEPAEAMTEMPASAKSLLAPTEDAVAAAPARDAAAVAPTEDVAATATADAAPGTGAEHGPPAAAPGDSFRERGRLRRRLRYLRRARELAFRDLGGLVFDLRRFGRSRDDLVQAKVDRLAALDSELRTLEAALDEREEFMVVREAGVAACPRCGSLHGSDSNFCPNCGLPVHPGAGVPVGGAGIGGAVPVAPGSNATA